VPRAEGLTPTQRNGLTVLAQATMRRLQSRRLRLESKDEANERARHMREIADLVPAVVWSADAQGRFDYFNSRWVAMTGREPPVTVADWRPALHGDDVGRTLATWRKSFDAGTPFECQYRLKQGDDSWRWVLARALPVLGPDGSVVRWYGTLTDIDEGERLSQNRDLLARELSHRIKNIFAVVSGLIGLRARRHPGTQALAEELVGAIRALGRAHDFVRPLEGEKGDSLRGLLAELMAPYQDAEGTRVRIEGGDCEIGPHSATPLALVFHELATNSAKYGAFSVEGGEVEITIDCPGEEDVARIHWRERGGPEVGEPDADGFGSRLISMSVERQLSGRLTRRFEPAGIELDLEFKSSVIRT
jgi:two-component sensor histidine kinase